MPALKRVLPIFGRLPIFAPNDADILDFGIDFADI